MIAPVVAILLALLSWIGPDQVSLWTTGVGAAASPTPDSGYAHPEMLADAAWLGDRLADPAVKVIALTPAADFAAGHIPGARQIDWPDLEIVETSDQSVAAWRGTVEERLTALGVTPADTVVVYDGGTFYAARLWWLLYQLGHDDVRVLDGGYPAWTAIGGEIETGSTWTGFSPTDPYLGAPDESAIATLAEATAALDDPDIVFIDARAPNEYAAGHIPGAVNLEFTLNAEPGQPRYWRSAPDLRAMYAAAGATPDKSIIPYCTTGVRSAATYFTLRLLGYENITLFTGSWKEWSAHPDLPVETGT